MRRNKGKILWGIALILAGLVLAGKYLLGWDITLMFDGWWTLFIIIPALISIIDNGFRVSNVFCLFLGALLLLACQESLSTIFTWKLVIPLVLVFIGISIIVSAVSNASPTDFSSSILGRPYVFWRFIFFFRNPSFFIK